MTSWYLEKREEKEDNQKEISVTRWRNENEEPINRNFSFNNGRVPGSSGRGEGPGLRENPLVFYSQ